jgi:CubicO group peptidase (beta-lactamase class C family)
MDTNAPSSTPPRSRFQRGFAAALLLAFGAAQAMPLAPRASAEPGPKPEPTRWRRVETRVPALSAAGADSLRRAVRRAVEAERFPGAVLAAGVRARTDVLEGWGKTGWARDAAPADPDGTVYDLASLSKAVATSVAVMMLREEGRIDLDAPVRRHLPEFEGRWKERVTWRHLLTHTSGLPGGAVIRGGDPAERTRRILRTRLGDLPGRRVEYTDLGFVALWEAGSRAAGEPLERYLERRLFRPLGMTQTRFAPGEDCAACAPTLYLPGADRPYRGKPHDLLARRLGGRTGNAGLFSTGRDMARLASMLAGGGALDGVRYLRPETVAEMLRVQPGAGRRTLGWAGLCPAEISGAEEVPDGRACRHVTGAGHNGYTGTSLWIDPRSGAWVVLLTNRTYMPRTPARIQGLRVHLFHVAQRNQDTVLDTVLVSEAPRANGD